MSIYINVADFRSEGSSSKSKDDTEAIQSAIDAAEASSSNNTVFLPKGTYHISRSLRIKKGIRLIGDGYGNATHQSHPVNPQTTIVWDPPGNHDPGKTEYRQMLLIKGESEAGKGDIIHGGEIRNIYFLGKLKANNIIEAQSTQHFAFDLAMSSCRGIGLYLNDGNNRPSRNNWIKKLYFYTPKPLHDSAATGLVIDSIPGCKGRTTRNRLDYADIQCGFKGNGIVIGDHDAGYFSFIAVNPPGPIDTSKHSSEGYGLRLKGHESHDHRVARKNYFGFINGSIIAEPKTRNVINWVNSEPSQIVIRKNASLSYQIIDRNFGKRYQTPYFKMKEVLDFNLSDIFEVKGKTPHAVKRSFVGKGFVPLLNMQKGQVFRGIKLLPKYIDKGACTNIELLFITKKGKGKSSGEIDIELTSQVRAEGQGLGSGIVRNQLNFYLEEVDLGHNVLQVRSWPIALAVSDNAGGFLSIRLERMDETTGIDFYTAGLRFIYHAQGPHGPTDATDRWDIPDDFVEFDEENYLS